MRTKKKAMATIVALGFLGGHLVYADSHFSGIHGWEVKRNVDEFDGKVTITIYKTSIDTGIDEDNNIILKSLNLPCSPDGSLLVIGNFDESVGYIGDTDKVRARVDDLEVNWDWLPLGKMALIKDSEEEFLSLINKNKLAVRIYGEYGNLTAIFDLKGIDFVYQEMKEECSW